MCFMCFMCFSRATAPAGFYSTPTCLLARFLAGAGAGGVDARQSNPTEQAHERAADESGRDGVGSALGGRWCPLDVPLDFARDAPATGWSGGAALADGDLRLVGAYRQSMGR